MELKFSKYQGAGNDFIVLDVRSGLPCELSGELVARLCCRRKGIGADGLMSLEAATDYDFAMRYFNADGGESTMCGNGGRCITRFAHDVGIGSKTKKFTAIDGAHKAVINNDNTISLQMIDINGVDKIGADYFVNTGSPHYIIFGQYNLETARKKRAEHNANVNFVEITGAGMLSVRTHERGVEAETWACGTGVTAAAAVANFAFQKSCNDFIISVIGGNLSVKFDGDAGLYKNVVLTGDAVKVFQGTINI